MKDVQTHGTRFCAWYYGFCFCSHVPKSHLHYTRGITPKRITSGGAHLRCLAPAQHSSREISQRWRVWRHFADLTGPGIEPQTSRIDGAHLTTELIGRCSHVPPGEKNWIVIRAKHQREVFIISCSLWAYFLFAASMRPTKIL